MTSPGRTRDRISPTLRTCNSFEPAAAGRCEPVVIWIDGESPLVGE